MYIKGRSIDLRPLGGSDYGELIAWAHEPSASHLLAHRAADALFTRGSGKPSVLLRDSSVFAVDRHGQLVGYSGMFEGSPLRHDALFEVHLVGELPASCSLEAWAAVLSYGFGRFPLATARRRVLACDERQILISRTMGFVSDGIERQAHWLTDQFHDIALLSLTRREWLAKMRTFEDQLGIQLSYEGLQSDEP